jgi:hypothetical protein
MKTVIAPGTQPTFSIHGVDFFRISPPENRAAGDISDSLHWQQVFTPLPASPKLWGEADPFFDNPRANCALARMGEQAVKQDRAEERARKRTRRQRRAAQRRHNRGRA